WETSQNIRQRWASGKSLVHAREHDDIYMQEEELVDGASPINMAGLVTVSARSRTELEDNCLQLLTKVAKAQCEVRASYWEQDSAVVGSAVPYGKVEMKTSEECVDMTTIYDDQRLDSGVFDFVEPLSREDKKARRKQQRHIRRQLRRNADDESQHL